jgi:hypothetical protein
MIGEVYDDGTQTQTLQISAIGVTGTLIFMKMYLEKVDFIRDTELGQV